MSKKNDFDFLDKLFDRLQRDDFINKTINDFGKEIKETIDHSVKNQGYDDISDMVNSAIRSKSGSKPTTMDGYHYNNNDYNNRFEYIVNSLQLVKYDPKYRGFYRDGHQEAIQKCVTILSSGNAKFDVVEEYIEKELETFELRKKKNKDKFIEGYIDGLHLMKEELSRSKLYMMDKVKKTLVIE